MSTVTANFIADGSGDVLVFKGVSPSTFTIDNVSLKEITSQEVEENASVKELLSGTTDEGEPIFFRADTQQIQLNKEFETYSNPTNIINRTKRGSQMKCFVALDDTDFYEIEGTVEKGVSILKINSKDRKSVPTPPLAKEIKISWRDSSKQICRLLQTAIVFIPGTIDHPST